MSQRQVKFNLFFVLTHFLIEANLFSFKRNGIISLEVLLISLSALIVLAIMAFTFASIIRRLVRSKRFKTLDRLRKIYREKLKDVIFSGRFQPEVLQPFRVSPKSLDFQAVEDVLFELMKNKKYEEEIKEIFNQLGYISYYENRISHRNKMIKLIAIDKLGKMKSQGSVKAIGDQLKNRDPEIITVAIRALANMGTPESLKIILNSLPSIYENWFITRKALENSLLKYGQQAIPFLLEYLEKIHNPKIIAIILDILSHFSDESAWLKAFAYLTHDNPEVKAKALKVISGLPEKIGLEEIAKIVPLLQDPAWFVRLHAVRVLGKVKNNKIQYALGSCLFDNHWRVRNEAANVLANLNRESLDIFLQALKYEDRYVRETICEEMEKTHLVYRLIENLGQAEGEDYQKSKEILSIMHLTKFSTPLYEYLRVGQNEKIKDEIRNILGVSTA